MHIKIGDFIPVLHNASGIYIRAYFELCVYVGGFLSWHSFAAMICGIGVDDATWRWR